MSVLYYPKKEKFKNPLIKNMCEYKELVNEFEKDYEGTWARFAKEKISWFSISFERSPSFATMLWVCSMEPATD